MESKSVFNDSKICGKVDIAKHDRYNPLIHDCSRKLIGSTPYFFDGQDSVMNKIQALSLGYSLVVQTIPSPLLLSAFDCLFRSNIQK